MPKILISYTDVMHRIKLDREEGEELSLWSYHPTLRPKEFTSFGVGDDEYLLMPEEAEKILPDYVKRYFEPNGPHKETMRAVVLKSRKGVAFIPVPCAIEEAKEILQAWRKGSRIREFEITLRIVKDDDTDDPDRWDWTSLLDGVHVEVIDSKEKER